MSSEPLSEADTRAKRIDPAIHRCGWTEELIRREVTDGAIEITESGPRRRSRGRTDYLLRVRIHPDNQPVAVAVLEAKAERYPPAHGLEQAKLYAACKRLNVPFVFASNGHLFVEFDRSTGLTSGPRPLAEFPGPQELCTRYERLLGFSLADEAARPLLTPYAGGEATRRYYQDAAIRATLEKIARCARTGEPPRALLSLATGAGKTYIAVQLLRRIADAGQLRRALFVCDRDELRTQAVAALQSSFGANAAPVSTRDPQRNAKVLIATYQTLGVDDKAAEEASFLSRHYPPGHFSHIVIDECHRSAWGKWSEALRRNPEAVQIGLTATPRSFKVEEGSPEAQEDLEITADNLRHFGEPVYEYDMAQGMEDGYLAACEIRVGRVSLDEKSLLAEEILARQPVDALTGRPLTAAEIRSEYSRDQYEDLILLPERVRAMSEDLFRYLLETGGPEQKTIVFCRRDRHADEVAIAMNNLYARWCADNGLEPVEDYAFKCTAASGGNDFLPDFKGSVRRRFIATTVDLLTTGVDVPAVRNIVFFRYVHSPISFYQMVGRGTRLHAPTDKLMFLVYDYTNATRLFGEDFLAARPRTGEGGEAPPRPPRPPETTVQVEGFEVHVTEAGRYILTMVDGRALPVTIEEYKERLAGRLVDEAPSLEQFRRRWIEPALRQALLAHLPDGGRSALVVREIGDMREYDLYDVLGELGYGMAPKTRPERAGAFTYKNEGWLAGLPGATAATVRALAGQFAKAGTEGLENREVFRTPEVARAGGLRALKEFGNPAEVLRETKERMFSA